VNLSRGCGVLLGHVTSKAAEAIGECDVRRGGVADPRGDEHVAAVVGEAHAAGHGDVASQLVLRVARGDVDEAALLVTVDARIRDGGRRQVRVELRLRPLAVVGVPSQQLARVISDNLHRVTGADVDIAIVQTDVPFHAAECARQRVGSATARDVHDPSGPELGEASKHVDGARRRAGSIPGEDGDVAGGGAAEAGADVDVSAHALFGAVGGVAGGRAVVGVVGDKGDVAGAGLVQGAGLARNEGDGTAPVVLCLAAADGDVAAVAHVVESVREEVVGGEAMPLAAGDVDLTANARVSVTRVEDHGPADAARE